MGGCAHGVPGGVGDDERASAQGVQDADREDDLGHGIAFVVVKTALHNGHVLAHETAERQAASVSLNCRNREAGNLFVGKDGVGFDFVGQCAKAGTENDRHH